MGGRSAGSRAFTGGVPPLSRIFIVGSGVVGSATGRGLAAAGHTVTFVDIAPARLAALADEGLDARPALDLAGEPESFIFLTLPTPNRGGSYDLTALRQGAEDVGRALRQADARHVVVVRSTVPPGTTEGVVRPAVEQAAGLLEGDGFSIAANPEFLRAASADDDFRWPWMTVVGARSRRVGERLGDLLSPFGGELRVFGDPATAELVKCAHNIYNAAKISFWNEMWLVCRRLGIDHDDVAGTVARSAEGSFNREYGIRGGAPYGGECLPKDTLGFLGFASSIGVRMPILEAVTEVNDVLHGMVAAELDGLDADGDDRLIRADADDRLIRVDGAGHAGHAGRTAGRR
jgi:UDPglucose 6-dehydrogenase